MSETLKFRVDTDEAVLIKDRAKRLDMTLSGYLRSVALGEVVAAPDPGEGVALTPKGEREARAAKHEAFKVVPGGLTTPHDPRCPCAICLERR